MCEVDDDNDVETYKIGYKYICKEKEESRKKENLLKS